MCAGLVEGDIELEETEARGSISTVCLLIFFANKAELLKEKFSSEEDDPL
jgi:hypothetical protein